MDCAEEVAAVKREIAPVVGGEDCLAFDILNGKMNVRVKNKADRASPAKIRRSGGCCPVRKDDRHQEETRDSP